MKQWAIKRREDHPGEKKWDDHVAYYLQKYSGVGVMMLASVQILYAFLFNHDTLPHSYFSFLVSHAGFRKYYKGMASRTAEAVGISVNQLVEDGTDIVMPASMTSREYISQHISPNIASYIPSKVHHKHIMCAIQHPLTESCTVDKFQLFKDEYLRSLKLYVPLNIVSLSLYIKITYQLKLFISI